MVRFGMANELIQKSTHGTRKKVPWKFNKSVRERFLGELQACGRVAIAARAVNVDTLTVKNFIKKYAGGKEFSAKMDLAIELYQARAVDSLESQALNGIMEPILDKNGQQIMVTIMEGVHQDGTPRFVKVPGWRRKYETALRVKVYERYNPPPKDPSALPNGGQQAGVLAVPVPVSSVEDWGKLVANLRKPVLVTAGEESK